MIKNFFNNFEKKTINLLNKRNIYQEGGVAVGDFYNQFISHAWTAHSKHGDGDEILDILANDTLLIDGDLFNRNFVLSIHDLYPAQLKNNDAWQELMPKMLNFKGKGVGVGELYLPLVVRGWNFGRIDGKGDGIVSGGIREVK